MKIFKSAFLPATFFVAAFPSVSALAAESGAYSVSRALERESAVRAATAADEFYSSARESTISVSLGAAYLFGMHGATSGGNGAGADLTVLFHASPEDSPGASLLVGGELLAFSADRSRGGLDTEVRSANLVFTLGASYDFSQNFSAGILFGYSFLGASYMDRDRAEGGSKTTGTMNSIYSVRPYAEFMFNKNLSLCAGYRFFYISPSLISSATNWGDIEVASHAVEFSLRYRF